MDGSLARPGLGSGRFPVDHSGDSECHILRTDAGPDELRQAGAADSARRGGPCREETRTGNRPHSRQGEHNVTWSNTFWILRCRGGAS